MVIRQVQDEEEFIAAVNKRYDSGPIAQLSVNLHGVEGAARQSASEMCDQRSGEYYVKDDKKEWTDPSHVEYTISPMTFDKLDASNFIPSATVNLDGCSTQDLAALVAAGTGFAATGTTGDYSYPSNKVLGDTCVFTAFPLLNDPGVVEPPSDSAISAAP